MEEVRVDRDRLLVEGPQSALERKFIAEYLLSIESRGVLDPRAEPTTRKSDDKGGVSDVPTRFGLQF